MTLEDLRIFVAAAETGSMSELARAIGRTQPAVAHHVRRLEQELGAPLLDRTGRGVVLTEAGRALYERATAALAALHSAESEVAAIRGASDGVLALASSSGAVRHHLKSAIETLRRARPALDLRLACANTLEAQLDSLRERRADLAFVAPCGETAGFQHRAAVEVPYALLVHREDPLARRARIDMARLPEASLIVVGERSPIASFVNARLAEHGARLEVAHTVDTEGTAVLFVELGLGQTLLPAVQATALARRPELAALPVRRLARVPFGWLARDFDLLPSAARELVALLDGVRGR